MLEIAFRVVPKAGEKSFPQDRRPRTANCFCPSGVARISLWVAENPFSKEKVFHPQKRNSLREFEGGWERASQTPADPRSNRGSGVSLF